MPENLNARSWMIAGSGGTLIAALLVYPADVLKTRLIVQNMKTQPSPYRGIVHAFRTIWKAEGFVALYKGVFPTFLGEDVNSPPPPPPLSLTPLRASTNCLSQRS